MKRSVALAAGRKLQWAAPLFAAVLLAGAADAADRVLVPEDMPVPFYAIGLGHSGESSDDWVVTAFCYPPDSFKANYDLFNTPVAPSLLPDEPCYLEGFAVFAEGLTPIQVVLTNVPGVKVPVWFTPVLAWTDKWTVSEMERLGSLRGWADSFQDVRQAQDASDPNSPVHHESMASGVLEDGRSFFVHSEVVWLKGDVTEATYNVTVSFGD